MARRRRCRRHHRHRSDRPGGGAQGVTLRTCAATDGVGGLLVVRCRWYFGAPRTTENRQPDTLLRNCSENAGTVIKALCIVLALVAILAILWMVARMPGRSFRGAAPLPDAPLQLLREALHRDVVQLAGTIGERN